MNLSGWIFLALAWSGIIGLSVFCFKRYFKVINKLKNKGGNIK